MPNSDTKSVSGSTEHLKTTLAKLCHCLTHTHTHTHNMHNLHVGVMSTHRYTHYYSIYGQHYRNDITAVDSTVHKDDKTIGLLLRD